MSDSQNAQTEEKKSPGRPAKVPTVTNTSGRPITLIVGSGTKAEKVTVLPTESKEVRKEFLAEVRKNEAAETFFKSGELVEG